MFLLFLKNLLGTILIVFVAPCLIVAFTVSGWQVPSIDAIMVLVPVGIGSYLKFSARHTVRVLRHR